MIFFKFKSKTKLLYLKANTDQIDILDKNFESKEKLSFKIEEGQEKVEQISCTCVSYEPALYEEFVFFLNKDFYLFKIYFLLNYFKLWVGNQRNGIVTVWSLKNFDLRMRIGVDDCQGYRLLLLADEQVIKKSKYFFD